MATDDLFYPATARGALRLPSRACCKNSVVTADPLTLRRFVCGMGVTVSQLTLIVKRANDIFVSTLTKIVDLLGVFSI